MTSFTRHYRGGIFATSLHKLSDYSLPNHAYLGAAGSNCMTSNKVHSETLQLSVIACSIMSASHLRNPFAEADSNCQKCWMKAD